MPHPEKPSAPQPPQAVTGPNASDDWWRRAVIYQIYPRSFADGNGDGIGDLPGVLSRLDHLANLGVDALWFNPFYPSEQWDTGYDVADYFDINQEYGTLADFDRIVARAHQLGMRVIIDVVPNHTASEHPWFQEALEAAPGSPARSRYIFRHSPSGAPNNWGSLFGGPAWTPVEDLTGRDEDRGWWYLHLFDVHQPDLNWENEEVRAEFRDYFRFWMDRGVDGFRVDVAHGMVKAPGLPDDEVGPDRYAYRIPGGGGRTGRAPDTGPAFDQDGVHEIYREWRRILEEYGPDRILVAEAWTPDPSRLARYVRPDEMSQAFNFEVLKCTWNAEQLRETIRSTYDAARAVDAPTTWVLSNHDVVRHASRLGYPDGAYPEGGIGVTDPQPDARIGLERASALTTLLMALPGSMYVYNGEELGLPESTTLPDEARLDPTWPRSGYRTRGRDGCRVPLPWEADAPSFGFSSPVPARVGEGGAAPAPWLPQPEGYRGFAVDVEARDEASTLSHYRRMIALRRELGLGGGALEWADADPDLLAVRNQGVLAVTNLCVRPVRVPSAGRILLDSSAAEIAHEDQAACARGEFALAPNRTVWIRESAAVR
jgi:alpha-glucosidase